ncbi:MAG TPA: GAF domain-containing sensor histidine kinase [Ktedonobacterales bacterium]
MSVTPDNLSFASSAADASGARADMERLQHRNRQLEEQIQALTIVLQGVANTLSAELDLPPLLRRITLVAVRLTGAQVGAAYVFDASANTLVAHAVETEDQAAGSNIFTPLSPLDPSQSAQLAPEDDTGELRPRLPVANGIAGHVARTGELTLIANAQADARFPLDQVSHDAAILRMQPGALMTAPMMFKSALTGVLQVARAPGAGAFDVWSLDLMRTLASQGAVAVTNAQLYRRVRRERDRIIQAQEDERKRLGRELHDGPAQKLAQVVMTLEYALQLTDGGEGEAARAEVAHGRDTANDAMREIRNQLFDLRPLALDAENGGLVAALKAFIKRFTKGPGPEFTLTAEYPERLSHNTEVTAFAIIQEAVNNVLKHAGAAHCWIDVRETEDQLIATVRDDGAGFDPDQVRDEYASRGSWGMLSMSERAGLIEAEVTVASRPEKGTVVTLTAPRQPRAS